MKLPSLPISMSQIANLLGAAVNAGAAAGIASWKLNPTQPWEVHAGAAGMGAVLYAIGHLRMSPLQPAPAPAK
jgi:hypothetical protein